MKETDPSFGATDRLTPDDARQLLLDMTEYMSRVAHGSDADWDNSSPQKDVYGDAWKLLYGITSGMNLMYEDEWVEFDWENGERINKGITVDGSWEEHYDEFGYGLYGRGLEIGRKLAFYEDRDFTFESNEQDFTIRSY